MATKDDLPPNDHSPLFLSERAGETGELDIGRAPDIGRAWDRADISSRILKATILAGAATVIAIAILWVGNPAALVANVTASWSDASPVQPASDPPAPTVQSTLLAQDLSATATEAPARDEAAAAVEPADQGQAGTGQPISEGLFKQFQAWAAEEDTRAQVAPTQPAQALSQASPPVQPVPAPPVRVAQEAPAEVQPAKKHRRVRSVHNARAEIRPQRHSRARYREEPSPPVPVSPPPDARAQEQPVQNSQTPWLLQSLGFRN